MTDTDDWVIEVHGPEGVKMIDIPNGLVEFYGASTDLDKYTVAVWLTYLEMQHARPSGD